MDRVHDLGAPGHASERQAPAMPLAGRDKVGDHALVLTREPVARAAEARLHLVGDEEDAVLAAPVGHLPHEARRRHDEPALALDRLEDDGGEVLLAHLRVHLLDEDVERLLGAVRRAARPPERVAHRRPVDLAGEGAEPVLVRHVLGGQRHGEVGPPVVAVVEGDDRLPAGHVTGDLDGVLDGLGAGVEQGGALLMVAGVSSLRASHTSRYSSWASP